MSFLKGVREKKNRAVQQLIGADSITQHSIALEGGRHVVYFLVEPTNLAVLSRSHVQAKVTALMHILKTLEEVELFCLGSRDDFEGNKRYLKERLEAEPSEPVRRLLEKDMLFLDQIQIQTASAREFAIALRFSSEEDIAPATSRVEKLLKDQGFRARLARQADLKRLYAVYFAQNMTQLVLDDYDGQRWVEAVH